MNKNLIYSIGIEFVRIIWNDKTKSLDRVEEFHMSTAAFTTIYRAVLLLLMVPILMLTLQIRNIIVADGRHSP